ncbi:putative L-alanine/L-glutamate racemase [Candidatus Xenohaliotis californiensis]|uniref:L-alanine/L-glutamate racemase n=1 Tax=Candidatus Xenohaliotis californiensis TaxID=84677 RepID=A0ABM9N942_9RICK|nr:putative L-alanine/L-glutamate racemase [Candidatus Xenohaliotis californiensis]
MIDKIHKRSSQLFNTFSEYKSAVKKNIYPLQIKNLNYHDYNYRPFINQTQVYLSALINEMEHGFATLLTPSCINAIAIATTAILRPNKNVVIADNIYPKTKTTIYQIADKINATVSIANMLKPNAIEQSIVDNTDLVVIENPGSYSFTLVNTENIAKTAKLNNAILLCDNSWATPVFHKPGKYGVDIVVGSIRKYMNDRGDINMGYITSIHEEVYKKIYQSIQTFGITANPDDCYNIIQNIQTIEMRMKHHNTNIKGLISQIKKHSRIKKVMHPYANTSIEQQKLWEHYFTGGGSLFSIILDKIYSIKKLDSMVKIMKSFQVGTNWGGADNLMTIINPKLIHTFPDKQMLSGSCLRIYCGLKHTMEHNIQDIVNGLNALD